jgi:DNA-binding transcriptional MerR regulator
MASCNPKQTQWLLTSEVAQIAAVAPDTVRFWERSGRLPARKTANGVRLFARSQVERFLRVRAASNRTR